MSQSGGKCSVEFTKILVMGPLISFECRNDLDLGFVIIQAGFEDLGQ